jgi:hypothetical protein
MRRRRLLGALAAGGLLAAGALVLWPHTNRVTRENFGLIREGMSRAEVESILGGPPGDYRTVWTEEVDQGMACCFSNGDVDIYADRAGPGYWANRGGLGIDPDRPSATLLTGTWFGNEGYMAVHFLSEAVDDTSFFRTAPREKGPLDNLLWRLRRQWRRWSP